jgi:hypothetical protein
VAIMTVTCLNQTVAAMTISFTVSVAVQGEASPDLTQAFTDACRKILRYRPKGLFLGKKLKKPNKNAPVDIHKRILR